MPPSVTYPGRIVMLGEPDRQIVLAIQRCLNERDCGPVNEDGKFTTETRDAVKLFQARFTDPDGMPLKVDGKVGPITWSSMFGVDAVPTQPQPVGFMAEALRVAASHVGVLEEPPGSNRGPQVDKYIEAVDLNPNGQHPWCAAFVYFCFNEAAKIHNIPNPVIKTAGVLDHWNKARRQGVPRLLTKDAVNNPALVMPGMIFVLSTGGGKGHTGLVEAVSGGKLRTIEGNTNEGGSREGIGVFKREGRKLNHINKGFLNYALRD